MVIMLLVFTLPFYGIERVTYTFTGPFEFQLIKSEENREFPNVYVSVAELQTSGNMKSIIQRTSPDVVDSQTGNLNPVRLFLTPNPFILFIYSIIYLFYSSARNRYKIDKFGLAMIWLVIPIFIVGISTEVDALIVAFFIYLIALLAFFGVKEKNHLDTLTLLIIWFLGPVAATLVAVRFSTLFSPPIAIGAGIIFSKLFRTITGEDKKIED
jgi:hypothetical protein